MALATRQHTSPVESGTYLTDGRRLYRVVAPFRGLGECQLAELEDCLTLETHLYGPDELWHMALRRVTATVRPDLGSMPAAAAA